MAEGQLARLHRIEVDGLFGIYDHRIKLNLESTDRVTILHGPNGVGKTSVLRMVDALLRNNITYFSHFPFKRFMLAFHDETKLELNDIGVNPKSRHPSAKLSLTTPDGSTRSEEVELSPSLAESIADSIDFLHPYDDGNRTWIDLRDEEVLTEAEVISRFGGREHALHRQDLSWFEGFLRNANTHFIEAQRLVRTSLNFSHWRRRVSSVSRVIECGQDLKKRMDDAIADYGRQAQSLDQSFPQRLISAQESLPGHELQERMSRLDKKTAEYKKIGVLDVTPDHPFKVEDQMDNTQARVMTLYVQDTEKKLQSLDSLAARSKLLLNSVNGKFRHKSIRLDREEGLIVKDDQEQRLPLDWLSSGEQHELVLHYDLLFRVKQNTVVLIDEPELSLHVEWQKRFLSDLVEIIQLSGFDAVVATHSPYIAGGREDLMVALGDSV